MNKKDFDVQFEEATRRGMEANVGEVHAVSARYDHPNEQLILGLRGGLQLLVPVHLLQGVAGASSELIAQVELLGNGQALHWEALDADFSIQSIAAGSFGSNSWMAKLEESGLLDDASIERRRVIDRLRSEKPTAADMGKKGGASRSDAKQTAARANGAKGGRKPKIIPSEVAGREIISGSVRRLANVSKKATAKV